MKAGVLRLLVEKYVECVVTDNEILFSEKMLGFSLSYIYAFSQISIKTYPLDAVIIDCEEAKKNERFMKNLYLKNTTSCYYSEKENKTDIDFFVDAILKINKSSFHTKALAYAFANVNKNLNISLRYSMWKGILQKAI